MKQFHSKKTGRDKRSGNPVKAPVQTTVTDNNRMQNSGMRLRIILSLICGVAGMLLYINTLDHGFVLDDNSAIENNWVVKGGIESIPTIFKTSYRHGFWKGVDELYRPIPLSIFAVLWEYFPGDPFPFHFLNIFLYALTGVFMFLLLAGLFGEYSLVIPFITTLIFIAHPVHTEVVANIKSLDDILALLLLIWATSSCILFNRKGNVLYLAVASVLFFMALMSKESAVTFLAAIPLCIYFFSETSFRKIAVITTGLAIPAAVFLKIRSEVIVPFTENTVRPIIDNVIYTAPDLMTQWATAFRLMLMYVLKMFWPHPLSSDYSYPQILLNGWDDTTALLSLLFHLFILGYAIYLIPKKRPVAFAILFYLVTISIYSNIFIVIGSPFAERFLYVPMLGFALIAAFLLQRFIPGNQDRPGFFRKNKSILITASIILIPLSFKTIVRNADWVSNYELFKADSENSPRSARIHYFYGNEIRKWKAMKATDEETKKKFLDLSISEYQTAIDLYPDYADPCGQMGMSYYRMGDRRKAYEMYDKAIGLKTTNAITYNNMGVLFSESENHQKALEYYNRAITFDPYYYDAWKNIGNTYYTLKQNKKSIEAFLNALKYNPDNAEVNYFLAIGLELEGRNEEAAFYYSKAYSLDPSLRPK